jgi:bifunctional N-acetylglucosamine-1-phosphate-uridyltransferase/glucosamine-1-phosphate-acetyltransferase GlmU-like protein
MERTDSIDKGTEIRPFTYIRENVIISEKCIIGNSCELKNSILLNNVQVPHFNYMGDSVLGNFVHLDIGGILANLKLNKKYYLTPQRRTK